MKKALLVASLLFPLTANAADTKLHPSLRALRLTPPTFVGSGFHAHERVAVSLAILPADRERARADARGRFRVRLAAVPACGAWSVRAVGSRGSLAVYRHTACASRGGVEGVVLRGPIVPVCEAGTPCDAPAADVVVQALRDGTLVAATRTGRNGRFILSLSAGDYTIQALGRGAAPRGVQVKASKLAEVAFFIDTGIR